MANTDAPRGAWPIRHLSGGVIRTTEHPIASAYGTNIFTGDFVKLVAGGGIEAAAAGDRLLGVFAGCKYTNAQGEQIFSKYWPASTVAADAKALVYSDPNIVFGVQSAGSTVAADVGNLGDHVAGAGSTSTGKSGHEINGTTAATQAGLRVLGKVETPGNDWGTNVDLEVQIYEHEFARTELSGAPTTPGV